MTRTVAALGLTRNEQAQGQAEKGFEEAARARARTTTAARGWTAETGADVVRLDDDEPGSEETRADDDDTGQGAGGNSGTASLEAASQGEVAATVDGKRTRGESAERTRRTAGSDGTRRSRSGRGPAVPHSEGARACACAA